MKLVYVYQENKIVMSVIPEIETAKLIKSSPFDTFDIRFYTGETELIGASYTPYFFDDSTQIEMHQTVSTEVLAQNINHLVIPQEESVTDLKEKIRQLETALKTLQEEVKALEP